MKSIREIQEEIFRLGKIIDAPKSHLTIGDKLADPVIKVEIHGNEYHYVVVERGIERQRVVTNDPFEIIYTFIKKAALSVASKYAATNKAPEQNFRRLMFQHQLELLGRLGPEWEARLQKEIDEILSRYPNM